MAHPIIGLEGLVTAKLTADSASALTYEAVESIPDLVEVTIEDNSGDSEAKYADNVEKYRISKEAKMKLTLELLASDTQTIADIFGHTVTSGVLVKKDTDKAPYRAFGFKADDGNNGYDGIWLKKCVPVKRTNGMTYRTKEGETITVQTVKIEFDVIPTIKDKEYQYLTNSKATGMETAWATWFNAVPGATT